MEDLKVIKVFEDRQIKLQLTEEETKDIISMKKIIGENNLSLQVDGKLLISHYVGFVQINKTRLLIYPKIAIGATNQATFDKAFDILIKLLSYSGFSSVKRIHSPQLMGRYQGDLLELFISFFIDELLNLFKRDINRNYNHNLENQSFIKGKIDFPETVKKNSFRKHLHYVQYDQFTENILLNRIFKTVVCNLIKKARIRENKMKLKQALLWLEDVESIKINNDLWGQVKFTRLNRTYEPAFNLAKLFYYNSGPNLNKGDDLTFSFLVPLNQLFERYVFEMLNKNIDSPYAVRYQGPIDYLGMIKNKKCFQLKPDISIIRDQQAIVILDPKYKEIMNDEGELTIVQADIYQMLAYSVRYECNQIVLVYPKFLTIENSQLFISEIKIPNYDQHVSIKLIQIDLEAETEGMSEELVRFLQL